MKKKVSVGVSNHHIHLTEETYNLLFNSKLEKRNDLHQIGEFASQQVVTLKTAKAEINNVRVLGPLRAYNQVEISRTDAKFLGINPPVRRSGNLSNSETITVIGEKGSITLENSCIIAERHVHLNTKDAKKLNLQDGDCVKILVKGDKACILYAKIKVSDNGFYELHLDFDDANAAGLENGDEVEIII